MRCCLASAFLASLFLLPAGVVLAQHDAAMNPGAAFDRDAALAGSQAAIGTRLDDLQFERGDGAQLSLHQLRGQPLVVSLIFTSCQHTCPMITRSLAAAVGAARTAFGAGAFKVATIGFDTDNDSAERMADYAAQFGIDDRDWLFLSGSRTAIERLTAQLGFIYFASPRGFDHLAQVSVIDSDMQVYAQIYGDQFSPPSLVEPLRRLALGIAATRGGLGGLFDRVRLFCTVYDPASGRYRLDYTLIIAFVTGLVCLSAIAVFVVRAWQDHARRDAQA